jgi:hypothetical protein
MQIIRVVCSALLFALCSLGAVAAPNSPSIFPCSPRLLPISRPDVSMAVSIRKHRFTSSRDSEGAVTLVNLSKKPIARASFAIEYRDSRNTHLLSMVYDAGIKTASAHGTSTLHTPVPDRWTGPLVTLDSARMQGYSPFLTSGCPSVAELQFLELLYTDDSEMLWHKASFKSDATIKDFPRQITPPPVQPDESQPFLTVLSVMTDGHLGAMRFVAKPESEPLQKWIEMEIRLLTFYPAMQEDSAQETQIEAVVLFPGMSWGKEELAKLNRRNALLKDTPLVLLGFGPGPLDTGWLLSYGNLDFASTPVSLRTAGPKEK